MPDTENRVQATTDILTLLRTWDSPVDADNIRDEAAREIERLRAALGRIARRIDLTTLDRDGCADVAWHRGEEARKALEPVT
jgi:hypothetical protein